MKKAVRWMALALVAVMLCVMMVGCGITLSGTYSAELDAIIAGGKTSYTFSGRKVVLTMTNELFGQVTTTEYTGEYEIDEAADGTMTISFDFEDDEEKDADFYEGTFSFEQTETSIKIRGVEYKKQ